MKRSFIMIFCLLGINAFAQESSILNTSEESIFIQSKSNRDKILVFNESFSRAQVWNIKNKRYSSLVLTVDEECSNKGIYVGSLIVTASITCYIDSNRVKLLSRNSTPDDHFSFQYLFETDDVYFFIMNGRPFPEGKSGYMKVKVVKKDYSEIQVIDLVEDVPGFSGAISVDRRNSIVYYTMYSAVNGIPGNILYQLSLSEIKKMIFANKVKGFKDLDLSISVDFFTGLSFELFLVESTFLYWNGDAYEGESYPSYYIRDQIKHDIEGFENCSIIGVYDNGVLVSFDANTLKIINIDNLKTL